MIERKVAISYRNIYFLLPTSLSRPIVTPLRSVLVLGTIGLRPSSKTRGGRTSAPGALRTLVTPLNFSTLNCPYVL